MWNIIKKYMREIEYANDIRFADSAWQKFKQMEQEIREQQRREYCQHRNYEEVGDQTDGYPGGDIVLMRCKDCGETWKAELPQ